MLYLNSTRKWLRLSASCHELPWCYRLAYMNYHGAIDSLMWHCTLEKGFGIESARSAKEAFFKTELGD